MGQPTIPAAAVPAELELAPPGCVPVEPFPHGARSDTFLHGDATGVRLQVRYFLREADGALVAKAWFGPGTQGPPGHAHGGSMAAVLDEVMGGCAWMHGDPVLAVRLAVELRTALPLGTLTVAEGLITRREGRKIFARGRLAAADGRVFAEGEGLFIRLTDEQLARFSEIAK
jgi:acyl-coenzyme A thioesterase PaaI-like protein